MNSGPVIGNAWFQLWRFHFAALSFAIGCAGMALGADGATIQGLVAGGVVCFLGYGVGMAINDLADREADAINAPKRPFVAGTLNETTALIVTTLVGLLLILILASVSVAAALWGVVTLVLHLVYTKVKGIPLVGNLTNGADIALFALLGAAAARPHANWLDIPTPVGCATFLCFLQLSGYTLIGYFKDIPGDTVVGYRTLPVVLGAATARWTVIPFPAAAVLAAGALASARPDLFAVEQAPVAFWLLLSLAGLLFGIGIAQLWPDPTAHAYDALVWYTRGAIVFALALAALAQPLLATVATVALVGLFEVAITPTRTLRQA